MDVDGLVTLLVLGGNAIPALFGLGDLSVGLVAQLSRNGSCEVKIRFGGDLIGERGCNLSASCLLTSLGSALLFVAR